MADEKKTETEKSKTHDSSAGETKPIALDGIIGKKLGTTEFIRENGEVVGVTAVQAGPCTVIQVKTKEKDGYVAVQLGFVETKRLNDAEKGHFKSVGGKQFRHLREFRVNDSSALAVGQQFGADLFKPGDIVDVAGLTKGRGFAGVVKRHGFKGGPKTHGQSDRQRGPGAIGAGTNIGHVIKGLRMAGHMGNSTATVRNLLVVATDPSRNLVMVNGSVPGSPNGVVILKKAHPKARKSK